MNPKICPESLTVATKTLPDGTKIQNIFAIGEDGKLYAWSWKLGEWELYAKPEKEDEE